MLAENIQATQDAVANGNPDSIQQYEANITEALRGHQIGYDYVRYYGTDQNK